MKRLLAAMIICLALGSAGLTASAGYLAASLGPQAALGAPLLHLSGVAIHAPWKPIGWRLRWADDFPEPFANAALIELATLMSSVVACVQMLRPRPRQPVFGGGAWARFPELQAAGLFAATGTILGRFGGEIMCWDGPEHQLLVGSSRSGKGRGHVVPTLLAWPHSALVLDVKGELADGDPRHGFPGTSGFRARLGDVVRWAPTRERSAGFNPLFEVRRGRNEVRDVQNIIEALVDPQGDSRHNDFWDRSAKNILVGVVLHVLYAEPGPRKTLAVVREKLRDLDAAAEEMRSTLHRRDPETGKPEVHPEVLHAAISYLAGEERVQSGVKATAESYFGLFADELVAANTSRSDFRIGDLMCGARPVTLYLQPPPSDAQRLAPLMRLLVSQVARSLMEDQASDAAGRPKQQRLLMLLDEFPLLGRMPHFEQMMGAMAGYGIKASLVCQSLNHIVRAYGRDNVILDNCRIVSAYGANDADTAKRLSDMAGEAWEPRASETHQRPRAFLGWRKGSTTIREERRQLITPADIRALAPEDQLVFVAGVRPIRAQKLRFDHERIFRDRLLPPAPDGTVLTRHHDWAGVLPVAINPPSAPSRSVARTHAGGPTTRPAVSRSGARTSPSAAAAAASMRQPDLFTPIAASLTGHPTAGGKAASAAAVATDRAATRDQPAVQQASTPPRSTGSREPHALSGSGLPAGSGAESGSESGSGSGAESRSGRGVRSDARSSAAARLSLSRRLTRGDG